MSTAVCALAIFASGNRSGWLGCVVIAAMLLKEKKLYGMLLVGMVAAVLVYIMMHFEMTAVFQNRWKQTFVQRNESDDLAGHILKACFMIGLEYPLAGVSVSKLNYAIGAKVRAIHSGVNAIESHNVLAHVWASCGVICFCSLVYVGWTMWNLREPEQARSAPTGRIRPAPPAAQNDGSAMDHARFVYQPYHLQSRVLDGFGAGDRLLCPPGRRPKTGRSVAGAAGPVGMALQH